MAILSCKGTWNQLCSLVKKRGCATSAVDCYYTNWSDCDLLISWNCLVLTISCIITIWLVLRRYYWETVSLWCNMHELKLTCILLRYSVLKVLVRFPNNSAHSNFAVNWHQLALFCMRITKSCGKQTNLWDSCNSEAICS